MHGGGDDREGNAVMNDEKLMQQALEALEREINTRTCKTSTLRAMNALRARLARVGGTCKDCLQVEPSAERLDEMTALKDAAYAERNKVVAGFAALAMKIGYAACRTRTEIEGWSDDWHGCVYIQLPTGQVSWHYHDSEAELLSFLPERAASWDGHETDEKYRRVLALRYPTTSDPRVMGEPSAEPVAWMNILEGGYKCLTSNPIPNWTPLYTAPPSYDDALERAARVCEELNLWNYDDPGESAAAAIRALIGKEPVAHADDIAVEKFAATMKAKLAEKRAQGYGGWDDTDECPADYLRQLLVKHVDKGDPVDVGNFAMMLWNRGERCAPTKESSNG
jgi:hypothetical protein